MLAAQPETVRQDLSQIKGTCGIHSHHEGSSWKKPTGLLSGGSPLKCQSLNHNPKRQRTAENSILLLLCSLGHCPLERQGWFLASKSSILLGTCSIASRLRGTVAGVEGVCSRLTQPGSFLPRVGGDFSTVRLFVGPAQVETLCSRQSSHPAAWLLMMPPSLLGSDLNTFTEPRTWLYPVSDSLVRYHARALCTQWKPKQTTWHMKRQKR